MNINEVKIEVSDNPTDSEIHIIEEGLSKTVPKNVQPRNYQPLAIFIKDTKEQIIGGLVGNTHWDWLNINLLWVTDELQGRGFGKTLIEKAEQAARKRNCHSAVVDTFDFQATIFYQKLGYEVFGKLNNFPIGHTRFYLKKQL